MSPPVEQAPDQETNHGGAQPDRHHLWAPRPPVAHERPDRVDAHPEEDPRTQPDYHDQWSSCSWPTVILGEGALSVWGAVGAGDHAPIISRLPHRDKSVGGLPDK